MMTFKSIIPQQNESEPVMEMSLVLPPPKIKCLSFSWKLMETMFWDLNGFISRGISLILFYLSRSPPILSFDPAVDIPSLSAVPFVMLHPDPFSVVALT